MPGLNPFGQLLSGVRQQSDLAQAARDVHILGLCGSLRRTSANRGLLEAAQQARDLAATGLASAGVDHCLMAPDLYALCDP